MLWCSKIYLTFEDVWGYRQGYIKGSHEYLILLEYIQGHPKGYAWGYLAYFIISTDIQGLLKDTPNSFGYLKVSWMISFTFDDTWKYSWISLRISLIVNDI